MCCGCFFAKDFSECGIDNYKIKVREYNWLINGHTDEQIQQHADELAQDDRRIFKRLAKEYKEKSLIILMDIQKVSKQLLQMPRI